MEPFDIQLSGESYTIQPLVTENFEVYQNEVLIGFLTPTVGSSETIWSSREIEKGLAQNLGELIERVQR